MFESMDLNSLLPRGMSQSEDDEEEESCIPALSWRERLLGCATCVIIGYILSFGSFFRIKDLILGNPMPFVVHATIGNIVALSGSCFLSGPKRQLTKMWHKTRRIATVAYMCSLVLTLLVAFIPGLPAKKPLLLILMLVQYVAVTWYCLSYIPFAREALSRWGRSIVYGEDMA